jgi:hypothetical protein
MSNEAHEAIGRLYLELAQERERAERALTAATDRIRGLEADLAEAYKGLGPGP